VSEPESPTPALFDHAKRVFDEMCKRATRQEVEGYGEVAVYEGHLTQLFSDLGIANPYYTKIRDILTDGNCMVQLRRGGGAALSKWVMISEPQEDTFRELMDRKRPKQGGAAILEQRVKDLMKVVGTQQDTIDNMELRLQVLENRVGVR
jgi:hypothetical protein